MIDLDHLVDELDAFDAIVGTGPYVAAELASFADRYGVDEVMISPIAGAHDDEPMDAATGRAQTLASANTPVPSV